MLSAHAVMCMCRLKLAEVVGFEPTGVLRRLAPDGFKDRCNKPLCHTSKKLTKARICLLLSIFQVRALILWPWSSVSTDAKAKSLLMCESFLHFRLARFTPSIKECSSLTSNTDSPCVLSMQSIYHVIDVKKWR
jgi:hypothetical protein